jgi:UDP-N-acetylglucosamine 2-epimerase (non-hydrolysing)
LTIKKKKRVACIAGTRPEVIKLAPVYQRLQESAQLEPVFVCTGQHKEMLAQAMESFALPADADLGVMTPGQGLPDLTSNVVLHVSRYLALSRPDAVLVQGDTTSVLGAGLAAFYAGIPVGHVEAGLRTYDMQAPWPEEMNRRLLAPLCRWSFAPTTRSRENLLRERIEPGTIHVTGNTAIDALLWMCAQIKERKSDLKLWLSRMGIREPVLSKINGTKSGNLILVTGHRRESFGAGFENICRALLQIAKTIPSAVIVYPVHLNPKVQEPVRRILGAAENIALIDPVGYEDFVRLMDISHLILTDSGGVQEEAPSLGKPVLVMRNVTERPEGVEVGTCQLVGTDPELILQEVTRLTHDKAEYGRRSQIANPYGDGKAAERIVRILEKSLSL